MYALSQTETQSLVEIELDPPKTGSILPKSDLTCDKLLQKFRFTFGPPKPLFRPKTEISPKPKYRSITKNLQCNAEPGL